MEDYYGKRAASGVGFGRRGSSITIRDLNQSTSRTQYSDRVGQTTRHNSMERSEISNSEKLKFSRRTFYSSSKGLGGSTFRPLNSSVSLRRTSINPVLPQETATAITGSREETNELDFNNRHEEMINLLPIPSTTGTQIVPKGLENHESINPRDFSVDPNGSSGSSMSPSSPRLKHVTQQIDSQCTHLSSYWPSGVPRTSTRIIRSSGQRHGLRNMSCTLISDVFPSACSSLDPVHNTRHALKKINPSGESSSFRSKTDALKSPCHPGETSTSRGKNNVGSSNMGSSSSSRNQPDTGPFIVEQSLPQSTTVVRNRPTNVDSVGSVRTRRAASGERRMRPSGRREDSTFSLTESHIIPQLPQTEFTISEASVAGSLHPHLTGAAPRRPAPSSSAACTRPVISLEDRSRGFFHGSMADRDNYSRINMARIAEVLLALERIEQSEELNYEQLLVLETNLFLSGLDLHDQHRDMRLDIDNMSYEELLALEDKMGTVSTALTEDALAKCMKRRSYMSASPFSGFNFPDKDDIKCSICQEEYIGGDEVGELVCEHLYHVTCIQQWLRQKSWCPICKAPASPS